MVNLEGTNPISGESIDATSVSDWRSYVVGGTVLVSALMIGRFAANLASERTNVGDTVSDAVLSTT